MPAKRHVITKDECARFNQIRETYKGQTLTKDDVRNLLKTQVGWYVNGVFFGILTSGKKPPVECIDKNKYKFPDEPVHISILQSVFKRKQDRMSEYNKTARDNRKKKSETISKQEEKAPATQPESPRRLVKDIDKETQCKIDEAVKLLKGLGWKLKKPIVTVTYEEI